MNQTVKLLKPSIEEKEYDKFCIDFNKGKYGKNIRFGQAFYNHFKLHRVDDQTTLHNIHAKDGQHAKNSIKEIFTFT